MKSAPGPFSFGEKGNRGGFGVQTLCVMDAKGRNIATVYGKENGEKLSTAKLFAASHQMFEFIKGVHAGGDPDFDRMEQIIKAVEG